MPTSAPPPLQMELPAVSFFGRSFEEYARFLALDAAALRRRAVLDVGAGPSSFAAEACRRGIDAVAVDPLYDQPVEVLRERIAHDYDRMVAQMRTKPGLFRPGPRGFPTVEAAVADRRVAAQRFLADYEANARYSRYLRGALPRLPFLGGAFDVVLCAHLLFLHQARFDFDWHVAACRELVRVGRGDVRIHPVCGPDGEPYPLLDRLRRSLRAEFIAATVVPVDYEFFRGSGSMLVLSRVAPRRRVLAPARRIRVAVV